MDALVLWDASSDPEGDLVGYNVWRGYADPFGIPYYVAFVTVGPTTLQYQFTGLDDFKDHHFAISSFDEVPNESALSTDITKRVSHRLTLR